MTLKAGDVVMAYRGIMNGDLLNNSVDLNIPPFLLDKISLTELATTRSVASVRIHVECTIGKVRRYSVLDSTFLIIRFRKIWVNCCYMTNLSFQIFCYRLKDKINVYIRPLTISSTQIVICTQFETKPCDTRHSKQEKLDSGCF